MVLISIWTATLNQPVIFVPHSIGETLNELRVYESVEINQAQNIDAQSTLRMFQIRQCIGDLLLPSSMSETRPSMTHQLNWLLHLQRAHTFLRHEDCILLGDTVFTISAILAIYVKSMNLCYVKSSLEDLSSAGVGFVWYVSLDRLAYSTDFQSIHPIM